MAYRISQPLAATQFNDDKPKKKKKTQASKTSSGGSQKTVTKRSGSQKTTTINKGGTTKTVEKVSKRGRVKSRTTDIDLAKGKATTTKRKGGRIVSKKTVKGLTPKQANQLSVSPGGLKSKVASNVKKADRFYSQDDDNKSRKKARLKKEREDKRFNPNKERRKSKRHNRKNNGGRLKSFKEIGVDIKEACKGKKKGTKKCASTKKRFK